MSGRAIVAAVYENLVSAVGWLTPDWIAVGVAILTLVCVLYQLRLERRQTRLAEEQTRLAQRQGEIIEKQDEILSRRPKLDVIGTQAGDEAIVFGVVNKGNYAVGRFEWELLVPAKLVSEHKLIDHEGLEVPMIGQVREGDDWLFRYCGKLVEDTPLFGGQIKTLAQIPLSDTRLFEGKHFGKWRIHTEAGDFPSGKIEMGIVEIHIRPWLHRRPTLQKDEQS